MKSQKRKTKFIATEIEKGSEEEEDAEDSDEPDKDEEIPSPINSKRHCKSSRTASIQRKKKKN